MKENNYYSRENPNTSGSSVFVGGRVKGLYLCVSKKDARGKGIEREIMVGDVPEKEAWAAYQKQKKDP